MMPMPPNTGQSSPRVRWQVWVKDIQGCPDDFIFRHNNDRGEFTGHSMGSSHGRNRESFLKALGVPSTRFFFRTTRAQGTVEYLTLHYLQPVVAPEIDCKDVLLEFSDQNVLLFWKTFCLLKERKDTLFSLLPHMNLIHQGHERLARYYRDFLSRKATCARLLTISISMWKASRVGVTHLDDGAAPSRIIERRILIARPHHTNGRVDAAATECLDVGSISLTRIKPGGEYPSVHLVANHLDPTQLA